MDNYVDLDSLIDYRAEYGRSVAQAEVKGDTLTGLCPFHHDKNPSFSVDLIHGKYHCFACGESGNYINFYAFLHNLSDTQEAYKQILEAHGIEKKALPPVKYTVEDYAAEKHFDAKWLRETLHMSETKWKDGVPSVKIPYFDINQKQSNYRLRFPKGNKQRFYSPPKSKLILYGEWRMEECRSAGFAVLVEGESDTQTLWSLGFPALGVPGATAFKSEWVERLGGIAKLYLHIEPDQGGKAFREQMIAKLREGGFAGEMYEFKCDTYGVKDPSDLYIKYGEDTKKKLESLIGSATAVDLDAEAAKEAISDAPIHLRQPAGWIYDDHGISLIDERSARPRCICRTPILLTKRLKSIETGDEKIEVAFKRDGRWHKSAYARSIIFQAKSITILADSGCTITSENAKQVVRFLEALEAENIDLIETVESTSVYGWQTGGRFIPGYDKGLVLDLDPSLSSYVKAYEKNGSLNDWVRQMAPHRERYKFRFILAAAFTAPLLNLLHQRIFFVYNWGGSKGGKTAALKAALSVWGDPEKLMVNFNATQVALENMASCFCDLPLGIDERQLAGNKQDTLEKIVYMLSSGTGRARGSKTGGLQAMKTWRTVVLATGEEPIANTSSQTGVMTRMIEVCGPPFDSEVEAGLMHQSASRNCGWAGPEFIGYLISQKQSDILKEYDEMVEILKAYTKIEHSSHLGSVAAVALADSIASRIFFGESHESADDAAIDMASKILKDLKKNEVPDVNISACNFISDWIKMNPKNFGKETAENFPKESGAQFFGWITSFGEGYILPTPLKSALEKEGYNYRKTVKYLVDENIIVPSRGGPTQLKKQDGNVYRVFHFLLEKLNLQVKDKEEILTKVVDLDEEDPFQEVTK